MFTHNGDEIFVDFIGKFEKLQEDFDSLCDIVGLQKTKLAHLSKSRKDNSYQDHYSDMLREEVRKKYIRDVTLLGYDF